ncbi:hypothetical protein G6F22_018347 [Rhizopus arrhizus]|nr:hypothetical protein G6F22_018347 [Rhizopus arrhizus]
MPSSGSPFSMNLATHPSRLPAAPRSRGHAAPGSAARLGQHGPVRRRLLPAQFPRLAHVPGRNDRDGTDRRVGHVPRHRGGRAAGPAVLVEHGAGLGLPADAPPDGRLPRHQRDGVRDAVHRGRGPGPLCWRAGLVGPHDGRAGQAVFGSG